MSDGIREFKYKGATVRPYEPFHENYSERFFCVCIGGAGAPSLLAGKQDLIIIIEDEET